MANVCNTQCPWKNFYTNALNYMDSLHTETCQPQMKIAKFIVAARHHFVSPAMNPKGSKKSTEQLKEKMENPINSITKGTADNRHSCQTTATKCKNRSPTPHPWKCDNTSCSQLNGNKENTHNSLPMDHFKHITRPSNNSHAKPSHIPILQNNKSHLDDTSGYESTDMELSASTPPKTHKAMLPRPSTRNSQPLAQQTKPAVIPADTQPQPTCKSPLLPTPPAPTRQHIKSTIPRPPTFNNSRKPTFIWRPSSYYSNQYHSQQCITGPSTAMNSQFHYQPHFTRPFPATTCNQWPPLLPNPIPGHQIPAATRSPVLTGPYPHTQGYYIMQVSYIPVLLPYPLQY